MQARPASPWLHEEIASRMVQRLQWFREKPVSWLHWEPVIGGLKAHQSLRSLYPDARAYVESGAPTGGLVELSEAKPGSWNPVNWLRDKSPRALEAGGEVDMLWANMVLHLSPYPQALLRQWHERIRTGGYLMFSCLGPDTLQELRALYQAQGWLPPSAPFTDMHDWGDMLVHGGFAEPVMDMERITLSYSRAAALLDDLRSIGRNLALPRFEGLRARGWRTRLEQAIEAGLPRSDDGRLQLTVEVVYGHAFKAAPRAGRGAPAATAVSVDEMRSMLRSGRR